MVFPCTIATTKWILAFIHAMMIWLCFSPWDLFIVSSLSHQSHKTLSTAVTFICFAYFEVTFSVFGKLSFTLTISVAGKFGHFSLRFGLIKKTASRFVPCSSSVCLWWQRFYLLACLWQSKQMSCHVRSLLLTAARNRLCSVRLQPSGRPLSLGLPAGFCLAHAVSATSFLSISVKSVISAPEVYFRCWWMILEQYWIGISLKEKLQFQEQQFLLV